MNRFVLTLALTGFWCAQYFAQISTERAPGAPGADAHWSGAAKDGFGTANSIESKVWFTLNNGVMGEVYYPTLDVPNVQMLQLVVVSDKVETEIDDTIHRIEVLDSRALTFRQINTAKSGQYTITKTYVTDPRNNTILIDVRIDSRVATRVYVYYDPSLKNSGMHDTAWSDGDALMASDGDISSALISSSGFAYNDQAIRDLKKEKGRAILPEISNGYLGMSDGLTELRKNWSRSSFTPYRRAANGNVVQVARLGGFQGSRGERNSKVKIPGKVKTHCTLALSFGKTPAEVLRQARTSLAKGFDLVRNEYEAGWHAFAARLPHVNETEKRQFTMAAMVLKALEDKTYRGATVASPSIPWGGGPNANEPGITGYHAVWARDLYQVATALIAIGDRAAANRALDYLFKVQQKPDGSFPQNSWVDGWQIGSALQMDEVAFPLVLAFQLGRNERNTWLKHVKPAADYILHHGPATGQERWEEKQGFSPSTIAAEIAGLVCAANTARLNGDFNSAGEYLKTADDWANNVERWTATSNGPYGDGHYYLRITENDDPNDGAKIEINSGGGVFDEREIVDAGFLELVRLGIKRADDPLILKSLEVVDKMLTSKTPSRRAWYRYNHDAYGERDDGGAYDGRTGKGRLWTLLSGERGEFEIARGNKAMARELLNTMASFANHGLMIPEQVWNRNEARGSEFQLGSGTGSATPLAWSMAQFIRLTMNLKYGRNTETPRIVADRYVKGPLVKWTTK